jgi:hypothetical protein
MRRLQLLPVAVLAVAALVGLDVGASPVFAVTSTACDSINASAAPASPTPFGTQVSIAANAGTCADPRFQFWILRPGTQIWKVAQAYSTDSTYEWDTASMPAGSYRFSIWARDGASAGVASNVLGSWDVYMMLPHTLIAPATSTPCTAVTATATPPEPQYAGAMVAITASAADCPDPRYEFWILKDGSMTWQLAQAYSTSDTFNWDTTGVIGYEAAGGIHRFSVWAKDASSLGSAGNVLGTWDRYTVRDYFIRSTPCQSVSATTSPGSPAVVGTSVRFAATANGSCPNPLFEFWLLPPGSQTWQRARSYNADPAFTWNTTGKKRGMWSVIVMDHDQSTAGVGGGNPVTRWDQFYFFYYTLT